MNKRFVSLIAALLVAIMLVPSVALAADITAKLSKDALDKVTLDNTWTSAAVSTAGVNITVENLTDGGWFEWVSDHSDIIAAPADTGVPSGATATVNFPALTLKKPFDGDVIIKGTLYKANGENTTKTVSLKVPLATVPETAIAFTQKEFTIDSDRSINISNGNVTFTPANATYQTLTYKVDDASVATVSRNGTVIPQKNEDGKVTVTATSKNGLTATVVVNIKKVAEQQAEEKGFTSLAFSASKTSGDLSDDSLYLGHLLVLGYPDNDPSKVSNHEKLVIESSKPEVATPLVDEDSDFWPVLILRSKGTTTITVSSWIDPTVKASIEVEVTDKAAEGFKSLKFVPNAFTLYLDNLGEVWEWDDDEEEFDYVGDGFWVGRYLKREEPEGGTNDMVIMTSSDVQIAEVASAGQVIIKKAGVVKITARSAMKETVQDTCTLTIKKMEDVVYQEIKAITSPAAPTTAIIGDEINLGAYIKTTPVNPSNDRLVWITSNPQIAIVNPDGIVTALSAGKVEITVYSRMNYSEKTAVKFSLEIKEEEAKDITEIKLLQDSFDLKTNEWPMGFSLRPYIVTTPAKTTDDDIIITSDDPAVVRVSGTKLYLVDEDGDALKPGTATLTVRTENNKAKPVTIKVTHKKDEVKELKFVGAPTKLSHSTLSINLLDYLWADPGYYTWLYDDDLTWVSDKPEYASVFDGQLTYWKPGAKVTITVSAPNGVKAECTIETVDEPVKAIKFANEKITLKVNEDVAIFLSEMGMTIEPADADEAYVHSLELVSSDPDVVAVEKREMGDDWCIYAVTPGTATVTAKIQNAYNEVYGSFEVEVTENALTSIKFAKKEYTKTIGKDGEVIRVFFSVKPYNANLTKNDIIFESSDRDIAEVYAGDYEWDKDSGMYVAYVYLFAPGTAKITARSADNEKVYGSTKVTAEAVAVKKVKLPKKSMKLFYYNQGETHEILQNYYKLSYKIQPSNAWYKVTWETTNPGVAFVKDNLEKDSEKGVWIVATGAGTATITMNVDDGTTVRQAKMKVIVVSKTVDLKLNKKKATITMIKGKDNTVQLIAYDPVTEDAVPVKWSSSNKKVASVSKDGLVKALKAGEATITATTKDGNETTAVCNITVEKKLITSLKAKSSITLKRKETKQLSIKIKPSDAYNTSLTFKSSDEKVATVDANGLVKGIAAGEAIITVKTNDGSKLSLEILVTVTK